MFKESNIRSFLKMISWRVWATLATMILVYIFVGRVEIALAVGGLEVIVKMVLYYFHERAWNRIKAGRHAVKPFVLWFTGLPCSGKSTLAKKTYDILSGKGYRVEMLDGDIVRSIFPQTGFSKDERDTHIRRVGFLASMLEKNGVIVVSSFVSPYKESREFARKLCENFVEIAVSTPLEECERRDVKGMYEKARRGEIENFTGVSDPYEAPDRPEIVVDAGRQSVEESVRQVSEYVSKYMMGQGVSSVTPHPEERSDEGSLTKGI